MEIEYMRSSRRRVSTSDKGCGRISHILEICGTAEAYVKRKSQHRCFHRFSRIARQTRIAIYSINRQGSQADTGEAMIEKINPRVAFIRTFENSVVSHRFGLSTFIERTVGITRAKDGGGTRIDHARQAERLRCFEDVNGADHVHNNPGHRQDSARGSTKTNSRDRA